MKSTRIITMLSLVAIFSLAPMVLQAGDAVATAEQKKRRAAESNARLEARLIDAAKAGGADDAFHLAIFYGAHDIHRFADAAAWFKVAAEKGHVRAQTELAMYLREGRGVREDWAGCLKWLRMAADAGDAEAEFSLAELYAAGFGEPRSTEETSVKLLQRSAAQGRIDATVSLARRYRFGTGVAMDFWQASTLYFKYELDWYYSLSLGMGPWLTGGADKSLPPEDAFGRFAVHYLRAVRKDNATSQNQIGEYLRDGWNTSKNPSLAIEFFRKAAGQKNPYAEMNLGQAYEQGAGVPKDARQALSWYSRAAEKGLKSAVIAKARLEKELSNQPAGPLPVPP